MGDLEEYASWEPDSFFLYDDMLVGADLRAFPEYPDGLIGNTAFWGGWEMRSPESIRQFAAYDIDLTDFDPEIFLRGDVYVASGRVDPPPTLLWNWLREELGDDVQCELWAENGTVFFFSFYRE